MNVLKCFIENNVHTEGTEHTQADQTKHTLKASRQKEIARSYIRTQLGSRDFRSLVSIGAIYREVASHKELMEVLPKPEVQGVEFKPACEIQQGLSLVTCCMNRNDHLARTLPTWLSHREIDEIVIVDWSSTTPVAITLEEVAISDPRVRILRVEDEATWVLSHAYNLGFRATTKMHIIKVDADVLLDPSFFQRNNLADGRLVAGNWRSAEPGQTHVNGFFSVGRKELLGVNGFDERIVTYGWDDDDLYNRLETSGIERRDVAHGTVLHLDHDDNRRVDKPCIEFTSGWDHLRTFPEFWVYLNREIASDTSPWDTTFSMTRFNVFDTQNGNLRLRRSMGFGLDPALIGTMAEKTRAAVLAINSVFPKVIVDASPEKIDQALKTHPLKEALVSLGCKPEQLVAEDESVSVPLGYSLKKPKLIVDAQHGLGNRLRAIAAGYSFAKIHDRQLVIRWVPDAHCDCSFSSLFNYQGEVEDSRPDTAGTAVLFDLMNHTVRNTFSPTQLTNTHKDIVVKSAYRFVDNRQYLRVQKEFLLSLRPNQDVQALVDSIKYPNDIAVHVRMNGGAIIDAHNDVNGDWSKPEDDLCRAARSRSHYGYFFKRLDQLVSQSQDCSIFLASDNSEAYEAFARKYGGRVQYLRRSEYGRSETQLKYAVADIVLLSKAPVLLGSNWSSFTEVAHAMSQGQKLELSGQHF
ncbi:glycosyltransferase [Ruegeria sp. B32]|uniref:glycosyltransferase n=1 Tax=Ruegeria sp. B32 TaxID=2867020 RepID=UPI0021A7C9F1|nr:glycosyltransferase [Ruegeria sp. B32]UWR08984.1 glycosyltransferase [Ruegeria sp. B32]